MLPAIVLVQTEIDLYKWPPLRTLRLADEVHPGFLRRAIGLLGITRDAGTNNVFPGGGAAPVARDNVIEIQVFAIKSFAAVLAGVFVALENVVTREFDLFLRHVVIDHQEDDARDPNAK